MKTVLKIAAVVLLSVALILVLLIGILSYRTNHKEKEVTSFESADGYKLTVYMIGDPDFPFGATHCRADLCKDGEVLIRHSFDVHDDGAVAFPGNFRAEWSKDSVLLIASGSEQEDAFYRLTFDGTVILPD